LGQLPPDYFPELRSRHVAPEPRSPAVISQAAGQKRLLDSMVPGRSPSEILAALCQFMETAAPGCHCGIGLIDWQGLAFRSFAAPSLPATFNEQTRGLPVRPENGPCATAVYLRTQVIAEDMDRDPLWAKSPFAAVALAHGLKSCCSTPIVSIGGRILGTLAILQRKPAKLSSAQQDVIAQVTYIAGVAIERAQSEAALKRSEAFLADAQRLSSSGSFSWQVATGEITWSGQLYRMFGFEPGMTVTLDMIGSRIHPEELPLFIGMIDRARHTAADFEYEHRLVMPDHSVKHLHLVAHATRDPDGQLEYIGAVQDITQRRLSEQALEKARLELARVARIMSLGALTASIAHEVNQPLAGIVTNASTCLRMLAAEPPDVIGARETAKRSLRDANRAADVIKRLRTLFAKRTAATETVDLNEAAREVIVLALSDLQRRQIILRVELADNIPLVAGDRVQLQQVILNLLLNAADAVSAVEDRPRQVLIRTECDEDSQARLSVRDTGVGLGAHAVDLFEPFHTTKSEGMGIGLFVSRFIVESHHGHLWATPNDGPGVTFSFFIPGAAAHDARTTAMRALAL
jgi:signal transduction histidine kinase